MVYTYPLVAIYCKDFYITINYREQFILLTLRLPAVPRVLRLHQDPFPAQQAGKG